MKNKKHSRAIRVPEHTNMETVMLKSSRQKTQWQESHPGKLGMADLHMHSTYSDGLPTIEQILDHVEHHTSLDVIAITDHDVIESSLRARDLWVKGSYRFDYVVGQEISTNEGHLLALFIEKRIPPHFSMERSIDLVHEQGGLAIVVHPLNPLFQLSCQREVLDRIYANKDLWPDGIHYTLLDAAVPGLTGPPRWISGDPLNQVSYHSAF